MTADEFAERIEDVLAKANGGGLPVERQIEVLGRVARARREAAALPPEFKKDVNEIYENGKHRRYGLLFSVNGGALAIGKIAVSGSAVEKLVFGGLRVWMLGLAMAAFSALMTYDIWKFGERMQKFDDTLFAEPGKIVLRLVGGMLILVGLVVALPDAWEWVTAAKQ